MNRYSAREIVLCALFVALVAVGAFIRVPIGPDVYTLQFMFTLLAGLILGPRLGTTAVAVYVVLGLIGVPVFTSGGGPGYVLVPTFGYLIGFIIQAFVCGLLSHNGGAYTFKRLLFINTIGMIIVYLLGMSYLYFICNYVIDTPVTFHWVIIYCGVMQVVPDFVLCIAAALVAVRCKKAGITV